MLAAMSISPTADQVHGPAVHVQGLQKSYKELRVLRGVDFEVARGSIFALLGSNGAGKTTVVKILSTLLKADTGMARVNGFDVATQAAEVRGSISLTGQFAAVDEILSGRENLVLVARLWHLKGPGAIADDLLRRFSLTEAGSRRVAGEQGAGPHPRVESVPNRSRTDRRPGAMFTGRRCAGPHRIAVTIADGTPIVIG
jgi:ABC-2 type transport system ATP-binding protein